MITRSADHRYTFESKVYPGVTDILEAAGASFQAASRYGANQAAEATADMIEAGSLVTMYQTLGRAGYVKGIAGAAVKRRDEAATLGSEVHRLADLVVHGKPTPSMTEAVRVRVLAYAKWWQESGWKVRLSEAMVITPEVLPVTGWGGTFDLLAYDADGRTVLADIKTGKLYDKVILQLAGYGMARYVQPASDPADVLTTGQAPKIYPMPVVDRYVAIHVTGDGVRPVELTVGPAERYAFMACVEIHHWRQSVKGVRL
jgi:hypothetical protein